MNAPDNVIQFPVAKSNSHYSDLYYVVVYSNDEGVVTGCHCLDCGVVHICGYLSIGSEMYELVEELDSNTLLDGSRNYLTLDDHIDLVVGRLNRRQHKVWNHSMLSELE